MTIDARAANESRGNCLTGFPPAGGGKGEKNAALLALAEKVEAATAGDWRLSVEVEIAVLGYPEQAYEPRYPSWPSDRMEFARQWLGSRYTDSLDAAMTLVPEGLRLMLSEWDDEPHLRVKGAWQAVLSKPGCDASFDAMRGYRCDHAATPALALTAATLRARAAMVGKG